MFPTIRLFVVGMLWTCLVLNPFAASVLLDQLYIFNISFREAEASARAEYEARLQHETEERARLAEEVKARKAMEERMERDRKEREKEERQRELQRERQQEKEREQTRKKTERELPKNTPAKEVKCIMSLGCGCMCVPDLTLIVITACARCS